MQVTYSLFTLGSLATMAAALSKADFVFPDNVPMHKRQTSGPAFECHSACGLAIQGSREDNYCENSEWLENLDGCLDCALEFNIWRYYGRLEELAEPCGIDATPRPVGGASSSSAAAPAEPSTSAAAEPSTSAAAEPTSAEEASSSAAEPTTAEEASTSAAEATTTHESSTAVVPTTVVSVVTSSSAAVTEEHSTSAVASSAASGVASASTHPTTPATPLPTPPVSEGAQVLRSGFVAAGVAILLAVNLM